MVFTHLETKAPDFHDYVMLCNSTGNQTVNLLPILQFCCKEAVIISTELTEKNGQTQRLIDILKKRCIRHRKINVDRQEEKNLRSLTEKILQNIKEFPKIVWNISGGQKIPASAFVCAFQERIKNGFNDDIVAYTEAAPPEIWYFGSNYQNSSQRTSVALSLEDLLYLQKFVTVGDEERLYPDPLGETNINIDTGRKALDYYCKDEIFREAFFNFMKSATPNLRSAVEIREVLKRILIEIKPRIDEIKITMKGYEDLESKISYVFSNIGKVRNREQLTKLIQPLKILQKPSEIYNDYWNSIKKSAIDKTVKNIEYDEVRLLHSQVGEKQKEELALMISNIGGEVHYHEGPLYKKDIVKFSRFKSNGILFEWMVAAAIIEEIEKDQRIKDSISEIYHSVKTKLPDAERPDAEHDIVIVTKFGTLIIIELKTYEFSGDLAQAQEGLAYKKSGPYGKAIIIGPLLTEMIKVKNDGTKLCPDYIPGPVKNQEETARQNNTEYYHLDKIPDMLRKNLFIK